MYLRPVEPSVRWSQISGLSTGGISPWVSQRMWVSENSLGSAWAISNTFLLVRITLYVAEHRLSTRYMDRMRLSQMLWQRSHSDHAFV